MEGDKVEMSSVMWRKESWAVCYTQSCQSKLGVWLHCLGTQCLSAGGCQPCGTVKLTISSNYRLYQQIGCVFQTSQYIHKHSSISDPLQRSRPGAAERRDGRIDLHIDVCSTDTDTWAQTMCPWWNTMLLLSWIHGKNKSHLDQGKTYGNFVPPPTRRAKFSQLLYIYYM